ncbi:MAG TPA: hypothetical protein VF932_15310 [Anaerolineae bacterium]
MKATILGRTGALFTWLILMLTLSGCSWYGPVSAKTSIGFGNAAYMIEIWASTNCVKVGDTLHVRGSLTNDSSGTRVFQVKDEPVFDIGVGFGAVRPSWSDGKALTTALTRLELKPFESRTLELDWVATGTVLTGSAGAGFIFGDRPDEQVGVNVPVYIAPRCPGLD